LKRRYDSRAMEAFSKSGFSAGKRAAGNEEPRVAHPSTTRPSTRCARSGRSAQDDTTNERYFRASLAPNQMTPMGLFDSGAQLHGMAIPEGVPAAACPKALLQCFTVSLKSGLLIDWCDGTKKSPCGDTSKFMCSATLA
jgi:hypothetical protein